MADAIAITLHQLPHSLGERAAKAFDIQRSVDVLCYAFLRCTRSPIQRRIVVPPRQAHCFLLQVNGMALLHPICPESSRNEILREN